MKTSIENVRQSLSKERKEKFDNALNILVFSQINLRGLFVDGATDTSLSKAKMKDVLDGKSGEEVIAEAEKIIIKRKRKEKNQALNEIQELQDKQEKSNSAKISLKEFKVVRSRFYKEKQEYGRDKAVIELTVRNGTPYPVSKAYFKGTLASPDRSVPWLVEAFNYQIPGGVEPGEEVQWLLAPNQFGSWGLVKVPDNTILTVEVEQIDGPDGKPLFTSRNFSERDAKRLKRLKLEYNK
jgi:hypothetical protein